MQWKVNRELRIFRFEKMRKIKMTNIIKNFAKFLKLPQQNPNQMHIIDVKQ